MLGRCLLLNSSLDSKLGKTALKLRHEAPGSETSHIVGQTVLRLLRASSKPMGCPIGPRGPSSVTEVRNGSLRTGSHRDARQLDPDAVREAERVTRRTEPLPQGTEVAGGQRTLHRRRGPPVFAHQKTRSRAMRLIIGENSSVQTDSTKQAAGSPGGPEQLLKGIVGSCSDAIRPTVRASSW